MATTPKSSAFAFLVILFANSMDLSSPTEPTLSASPAVLPYVAAPEVSSFFPSPSADRPWSSAAPPEAESSEIMAPSSGEFVGKKSSGSTRLHSEAAIVGILLCSFLLTSIVVV